MKAIELLVGRILLAQIFIMAGINKLGAGYSGTQAYMESMGVVVIALEIAGGLALAAGFITRYAAWALAAFTVVAGVLFHANFSDQMQSILFAAALTGH